MSLWLRPAQPVLGGWLAVRSLGLVVLTPGQRALLRARRLRGRLPPGGEPARRPPVRQLPAGVPRRGVARGAEPPPGALWVGMEATTLALAPLIFHRHDRRSLEAVWKYLVLSSVGIALALLGMFFLATAQVGGQTAGRLMVLEDLVAQGPALEPGLAPGGVHLPAGGVRHQDGPGADAHLEAGHLRRGAAARGRADGRRAHQLRFPRDRTDRRGHDGGGARRLHPAAPDRLRAALARSSRPSS